jgi:hypothetical protein
MGLDVYRSHTKQRAESGAAITIYTDKFPEGFKYIVFNCVAVDRTSAVGTRIEVGIDRHGTAQIVDSQAGSFAAGVCESVPGTFIVLGGERVYAVFSNASQNDILELALGAYQMGIDKPFLIGKDGRIEHDK